MHISHCPAPNNSHLQAWATPALDQTPSLVALMSTLHFQKIVLLLNDLYPTIAVWSNAIGSSYENWVSTVSALSRFPVVFVDGVRQESGRTAHLSVRKWGTGSNAQAGLHQNRPTPVLPRQCCGASHWWSAAIQRIEISSPSTGHLRLFILAIFNHLTIWKKYI